MVHQSKQSNNHEIKPFPLFWENPHPLAFAPWCRAMALAQETLGLNGLAQRQWPCGTMDYICLMAKIRNIDTLTVDSSVPCCNFVNTVSSWKVADSHDYLENYDSFLAWCQKLGICAPVLLDGLRALGRDRELDTARALGTIRQVRGQLQRLIASIAHGDTARTELLLPELDPLLREVASREQLGYRDGQFSLGLREDPEDLLAPLWPVVHSLKELLTQNDIDRIKECPKCGWVFLDETKNGRRKWCNPQACGSTDKMERYNRRKKESRA